MAPPQQTTRWNHTAERFEFFIATEEDWGWADSKGNWVESTKYRERVATEDVKDENGNIIVPKGGLIITIGGTDRWEYSGTEYVNHAAGEFVWGEWLFQAQRQQGGSTTSAPPVTSNCRGWDYLLPVYQSMAKEAIGTTYREFPTNPGGEFWRIEPNNGLSEAATIEAFKKAGWQPYTNINPEHYGGSDYEKYHDGAWYHLTIGYGMGTTYQRRTNAGGKGYLVPVPAYDSSRTPPWITLHCERGFQPSSLEHANDFMTRKQPTLWGIIKALVKAAAAGAKGSQMAR